MVSTMEKPLGQPEAVVWACHHNGAETMNRPAAGGPMPFHCETSIDVGRRPPGAAAHLLTGVIKPGMIYNDIISQ